MLERDRELERLGLLREHAREGLGGIAVLQAAAGLGKSSLLASAIEDARAEGMLVLHARGAPQERDLPFGVALQCLEAPLAAAGSFERKQLLSGSASLALPLLEGSHWRSGEQEQGSIGGLLHGLLWLTVNLASRTPVLLAVDDLHWADAPSLRFLLYLAQRIEDLPVAGVLALRPGESSEEMLIGELAGHPQAQPLALQALSESAVARLIAAALASEPGPRFVQACAETTGGNPFLVGEVLRAVEDDAIEATDANAARIAGLRPEAVAKQLLVRISRLGAEAATVAASAAVLGDGALPARVAALAGLDPEAAARAADALLAAEIISSSAPISFAHPLLRSALYDDLPAARRDRLHARAARLLHAGQEPSEAVAVQLLDATAIGESWAAQTLRDAGAHMLAAGSPEAAIEHLRRALEEPLSAQERAETLLMLAGAESMLGAEQAEAHIHEALTLTDEPRACAEAWRRLGGVRHTAGDFAGAATAFERGLGLLKDTGGDLSRELHAGYFAAASLDARLAPSALQHLTPLLQRPPGEETAGERFALAALASHRAMAGAAREEALALARRAWGRGELLADEGPDGWSWSLVTAVLTCTDELQESLAACAAAIEQARRRGSQMAYATASFCSQSPALLSAQMQEALAHGEAALGARRYGWHAYASVAAAWHAFTLIEHDELDAAEGTLAVLQGADPDSSEIAPALAARGRLRLLQARSADALADFEAAGRGAQAIGFENQTFVPWRAGAALAAHKLGEQDRAARLLDAEERTADATGTPSHRSRLLRARAAIAGAEQGVTLLREALEVLEGSDAALERLRCLADLGAALRRAGERAQARTTLRQALELAHRAGARRIERRAHEELKVAGARPRRLMFSGPEALTASERRVAAMATEGMSNRAIAEALFVTPRTVEQHLYNTYKKLGIGSRRELARALREPGPGGRAG